MEFNDKIKQNNDFVSLIEKKWISKKYYQSKYIYFFIKIISITLYSCFIAFVSYCMFSKKSLNKFDNYSTLDKLKILTYNEKLDYQGAKNCLEKDPDEQLCIYQYLCPKEVKGKSRILMGDKNDGSYVLLNDFENVKIAYSIGIRDLIQFDKALADRGIEVYMYDHTIEKLPYENSKFHWKKIGLGGNDERSSNIQTLEDMIKENGHLNEKNMILKIDIEGNEWKPMNDISDKTLNKFKYILIEYHFRKMNPKIFYEVLKKVYKTHQIFYLHCCPYTDITFFGNNRICKTLEVSYIIRKGNIFIKDRAIYPIRKFSYANKFNINILKLFDRYEK